MKRTLIGRPEILVLLLAFATLPAPAADIYVAPDGSDRAAGTREHPFATPARAREAARLARRIHPNQTVTVWIRGGDYLLNESLELTSEDSGTAGYPTIYRSMDGETVRLIGARRLRAADFKSITRPETLARIALPLQNKVLELDLQALNIQHLDKYPDVFTDHGGIVSLYVSGARMPLSRYPNEGYMTFKRVLDTGGGLQDRNWARPTNVKPPSPNSSGTFEYREADFERFGLWRKQLDRGVWLKGYWRIPWQNEAARLQSIDTAAHTATLAKAVPGGIGNKYTRPEGNGQEPYWLLNLLEEVDRPGEWCLDFRDRKIYFYPPEPLEKAEILLADLDQPLVHVNQASNIVLRGLTVEGGLHHGVLIRGGSHNLVAGCTIRNVNRYGVVLEEGSQNQVLGCDLYTLGAGGVWLSGGDEKSQPRVRAGHRVVNNHIHHFAQIERVYAPGVNSGFTGGGGGGHHTAVGMVVAHNLIHDTPHAGVLFGSWDSLFEFNEVFRFCTVSNDMGAFYAYDAYSRMGNMTFRYNLIHSSDEGDGIYFDMDHRDMQVYGNIVNLKSTGSRGFGFLYKIGSQAQNPTTIQCYNNIAIACNRAYEFVSATPDKCKIENNVAVRSKTPWRYSAVREGKAAVVEGGYAGGKMIYYDEDPGFVDLERLDLRLKPGARLLQDLPGFQAIPAEKIGLYLDEYRRKLPSAEEIDRFNRRTPRANLGLDILDRN